MRSRWLFALVVLAAFSSLADAVAQPRTAASLQVEQSLEAMKVITSKPYSFVDQEIVGRSTEDLETWNRQGWALAEFILSVTPSEIDDTALDHLLDQISEPGAWPGSSPLPRALGHLG